MGAYARHIKNGKVAEYVVRENRKLHEQLRSGRICAACARQFTDTRPRDSDDPSLCVECKAAL